MNVEVKWPERLSELDRRILLRYVRLIRDTKTWQSSDGDASTKSESSTERNETLARARHAHTDARE
jgi:hypothetical protein